METPGVRAQGLQFTPSEPPPDGNADPVMDVTVAIRKTLNARCPTYDDFAWTPSYQRCLPSRSHAHWKRGPWVPP